jgi:hypothetical protein
MYKAHYNEKMTRRRKIQMTRQRKIQMMRLMGMEVKSGSEKCITPEEKWNSKECQWEYVDTEFEVDPTALGTSCVMESPPSSHGDDEEREIASSDEEDKDKEENKDSK